MNHLEFTTTIYQERIKRTLDNLKAHFFVPIYAENSSEAVKYVSSVINETETTASGGSITLIETGIIDYLKNETPNYIQRDNLDADEFFKKSQSADVFLCSANAIAETGHIINVDSHGNRIASAIFGPKKVIIVAGINKIVKGVTEAMDRIQYIAGPANNIRLKTGNPCTETGVCMNCNKPTRLCSNYVIMGPQNMNNRIHVVLVNETLGF